MADDTPPNASVPSEKPSDTRRDGKGAGTQTPKAPQSSGPRLVGPEDEERRGGVPGLESDD